MDDSSWNTAFGRNGAALAAIPLLLAAATTIGVVGAAARGRLEPNRYFGIRLPPMMTSGTAWREGHKSAFIPLCVTVLISAALALWAMWYQHTFTSTVIIYVLAYAVMIVGSVISIGKGARVAEDLSIGLPQPSRTAMGSLPSAPHQPTDTIIITS